MMEDCERDVVDASDFAELDDSDAVTAPDYALDVLHVLDYQRGQRPPAAKLSKWPVRRLSRVTSIVVHQTAVAGGFAVKSYQSAAAIKQRPDSVLDPKVEGLLYRYRRTAYHAVYNPRLRVSVQQWHPKYRTNHGHGSNRYSIGWAYDGHFTETHNDKLDVLGGRASLVRTIAEHRALGCPIKFIEAHRQHDDDRGDDPGNEIWAEIVIPIARLEGLELREAFTTGSGRPIPKSWHVG